jgi:hypothetical protein
MDMMGTHHSAKQPINSTNAVSANTAVLCHLKNHQRDDKDEHENVGQSKYEGLASTSLLYRCSCMDAKCITH